ncbi:MAG TPA: hypothetical protein VN512_13195 [Clostridia bacterium]|nr:hypothetical protein [Clostridia bacterium]
MFLIGQGNRMRLTRGDTARFSVTVLNPDGTEYTPQEDDVITFTVKKHSAAVTAAITKMGQSIVLEPADTSTLDVGEYVWDIDITLANGDVHTIITESKLSLEAAV